jgi:TonB family protein
VIAAWVGYGAFVSLLLGVAAHLLERGASGSGFPSRGPWTAAVAGSFLIPAAVYLASRRDLRVPGREVAAGGEVGEIEAVVGPVAAAVPGAAVRVMGVLAAVDPVLVGGWVIASSLVLLIGILSLVRLHVAERHWRAAVVAGEHVRVSERIGPAVLGFIRQRIVVPGWVLSAPEAQQRIIIAHEREHVRAGDHRLVLLSSLLLCLVPWNLPLWWIVRRLRLAVEMDCDARVLRGGADPHLYGSVLLEVGVERSPRVLAATALGEPRSNLRRRIEMIVSGDRGPRPLSLLALGVGVALVGVACALDQPRSPVPTGPVPEREQVPAQVATAEPPTFTPYDVKPELLDAASARRLLAEHYPPMLRGAGIGGTTVLWVFIDEQGAVTRTRLVEGSGHTALDEAAEVVMRGFRFAPARHRGQPVPVWIQLPIRFAPPTADAMAEPLPPARQPSWPAAPAPTEIAAPPAPPAPTAPTAPTAPSEAERGGEVSTERPTFTPYDVRPELTNRADFATGLDQAYPPLLREAGIGGTTVLWVMIDAGGQVANTRVTQSSGHVELDEVAEAVMRRARFTPARNQGKPVAVWIQLPVTFQTRQP